MAWINTIGNGLLQDADPGVRLDALLALSELPASQRVHAVLLNTLYDARNAADPWLPDAIAIAGAKQGPAFLVDVLAREAPTGNAEAMAGLAAALQILARHHAAAADTSLATQLIDKTATAGTARATAVLTGLAEGWPDERPPTLSADQRATLANAARALGPSMQPLLARIGERWAMPDLFPAP